MTARETDESSKGYILLSFFAVVVGVVGGQLAVGADVKYEEPAVGVSVFAVIYVLAQSIERLVEWTITAIDLFTNSFAEGAKKNAVQKLRVARSTANGNPIENDFGITAANAATAVPGAEKAIESARKDLAIFGQGLSFALAYVALSYFEYGIFRTIGVTGVLPGLDRCFTALAVTGGSKGLHDLISKIQKSKEKDETKANGIS